MVALLPILVSAFAVCSRPLSLTSSQARLRGQATAPRPTPRHSFAHRYSNLPISSPATTEVAASRTIDGGALIKDGSARRREVFARAREVNAERPRIGPIRRLYRRLRGRPKKPGTLVLLRHGASYWNINNTFTGWADPDLTEDGRAEVKRAARLLLERGYEPSVVYTSRLKRAVRSAWILLKEMNIHYRPIFKEYRLNERMYGALTGMSKSQIALTFGEELVQQWRRSLDVRPPALDERHPYWPGKERKYQDIPRDKIPKTESLRDTMNRAVPLFKEKIEKDLRDGKDVLVVGHYNSLRGLIKHIDSIDSEYIRSVEIPTGIPLVFEFDNEMKPIRSNFSEGAMSGSFLATREVTLAALKRERELAKNVPGFTDSPLVTPVLRAISSLQREREILFGKEDGGGAGGASSNSNSNNNPGTNAFNNLVAFTNNNNNNNNNNNDDGEGFLGTAGSRQQQKLDTGIEGPLLIIMRHGKTEFNKLGLFTGWNDCPLSDDGRREATTAGRVLRSYNVEIDEVHTSCLSRAIETAWLCMEEMDCVWVPVRKSWRLNERMYGGLTGLSKKLISQLHGEKQFKKWRRGFDERPPPVDAFSPYYPGNDKRYVEMMKDVPISVWQTMIRSLEAGRFLLARKMPRTESLKDCMSRTIPYFKNDIMQNLYSKGSMKNTLVVSSENAIRGLLMELCDITEGDITSVEIPTGLPMLYDRKTRSICLLDDGKGDPLSRYNFGSKPELLFKNRITSNGSGQQHQQQQHQQQQEKQQKDKNQNGGLLNVGTGDERSKGSFASSTSMGDNNDDSKNDKQQQPNNNKRQPAALVSALWRSK